MLEARLNDVDYHCMQKLTQMLREKNLNLILHVNMQYLLRLLKDDFFLLDLKNLYQLKNFY